MEFNPVEVGSPKPEERKEHIMFVRQGLVYVFGGQSMHRLQNGMSMFS
jgi:hypothetical protein